ncbi:MAG: hypothetical protein ABFC88_12655 [Thermoguttaceae bacterium]
MNQYSNAALIADMREYPSATSEENDRLFDEIAAGNDVARDRMVTGNMYLVVGKVDGFIRRHPTAAHLRDDLTSAGFTGLLLAVTAISGGEVKKDNVTGYLAVCIGRELEELMDTENTIYIGEYRRRYAKKQGRMLDIPIVQALHTDADSEPENEDDDGVLRHTDSDDQGIDPTSMTDLRDLLDSCCLTDAEREFIRLREESYNYREIAEHLGVTLWAVTQMKTDLYERFLRKSGMAP